MKCLIIAAGLGSRLRGKGDMKPLINLNGIPLIERVVTTVKASGVSEFFVVVGYKSEKLTPFLEELAERHGVSIKPIYNDLWKKPNGLSVLKGKDHINDHFFLTMTDHIYDKNILVKFKEVPISSDELFLAVDYNIDNNHFVDIDDVTKVLVEDGKIKDIGKSITNYNAFDTGIFLSSPALFESIEKSASEGDESLSGGVKALAALGKAKVFDIGDEYWIDVDDENAFKKAHEKMTKIEGVQ